MATKPPKLTMGTVEAPVQPTHRGYSPDFRDCDQEDDWDFFAGLNEEDVCGFTPGDQG